MRGNENLSAKIIEPAANANNAMKNGGRLCMRENKAFGILGNNSKSTYSLEKRGAEADRKICVVEVAAWHGGLTANVEKLYQNNIVKAYQQQ